MSKFRKITAILFVKNAAVWSLAIFITFYFHGNTQWKKGFFKLLTLTADTTVHPASDTTLPASDSLHRPTVLDSVWVTDTAVYDTLPSDSLLQDSVHQTIDSLLISKDSLNAPIEYAAEDSGVMILPTKEFSLYGKAQTKNNEMSLTAATIYYNQQTQIVKAFGGIDTANNPLSKPTLVQGASTSISDTIYFNLKNQKGVSKNTFYNEGELFINAQKIKKVEKDVAFAFKGRFTTCNLDTPHFAIRARKLKMITNKIAVSGPAFAEVEGVPLPVGIPFGIYPLNRGRHSGFLPPAFTSNEGSGLGLEGLGYYQVINDYWDVTFKSNLYSYGGWYLSANPRYFKRYHYSGNFILELQKTKLLNNYSLSKEEFTENRSFFITWSHAQDTKARPGTSLSANVRFGSTKFNQYVTNNPYRNYQNQLNSSIAYSKTWGQGKYNLSVTANHDQNNNLGLVNIRLPTVNFTMTTIYPFQKKEQVGLGKWYEKIGLSYSGSFLDQVSFYDSAFSLSRMWDTLQWGMQHNIPVTLTLPPLGPLIVSPSFSYGERWYGSKRLYTWNNNKQKVDTSFQKGFYTAREMSMGLALNTRIFGTVNFPRSKGITAIRHEIKPNISISYKPDLVKQYFHTIQVDSTGRTYTFGEFDGSLIGSYGKGSYGGINFGIDNMFEMKVRNKKDTSGENAIKKVKLIDGLSFNTGYNFLADSFQWQPISINLRSTLFGKINITAGAGIDPYDTDSMGMRINKLLWSKGKIGRLTNGNISVSGSFQSKAKDERADEERLPTDEILTPDEQMRELEYIRENPAEFVDFNIPWTVNVMFSLSFYKQIKPDFSGFTTQTTSSINLNGDFSLSPKWKIGGTAYFDFNASRITMMNLFITREMHCWQMAINVTPVGLYRSFNITINPKSGILRDLKINRTRSFYTP